MTRAAARAATVAGALAVIAAGGVAVATALALVAGAAWPVSLLEHFRLHYVAIACAAAIAAAAARRGWVVDVALIAAIANLAVVTPALRAEPLPAPPDAVTLRVLVLNVYTANTRHADVRALIDRLDPDVVALMEVDRRWLDALAPALARYPGRIEEPRADNFGMALYHRGALVGEVVALGGALPTIVATIERDGARATVIATHPIPPVSRASAAWQARQLDAVADVARARAASGPVIVLGDLNATPWSRPFQRVLARGGLRDTRAGFGVQATFPADTPWLAIPIDHALVSPGVGVRARRVEADVGSDHRPVYVELLLPGS